MKIYVDRIEEGIAVCEGESLERLEVPLSALPVGVREGSVLLFDGAAYSLDTAAEEERRRKLSERQKRLFRKP